MVTWWDPVYGRVEWAGVGEIEGIANVYQILDSVSDLDADRRSGPPPDAQRRRQIADNHALRMMEADGLGIVERDWPNASREFTESRRRGRGWGCIKGRVAPTAKNGS